MEGNSIFSPAIVVLMLLAMASEKEGERVIGQ